MPKLKTQLVILVLDLGIILFGLLLRSGVIACETPPNNMYFLGPYLLLLTLLINIYREAHKRKK